MSPDELARKVVTEHPEIDAYRALIWVPGFPTDGYDGIYVELHEFESIADIHSAADGGRFRDGCPEGGCHWATVGEAEDMVSGDCVVFGGPLDQSQVAS